MASQEAGLQAHKDDPKKLILVDGTFSMTGNYADIPRPMALAQKYDAVLLLMMLMDSASLVKARLQSCPMD